MKKGPQYYIDNVHTDLKIIALDQLVLPITLSQWHPNNSYVCSPHAHYITYAKAELYTLQNPILEGLFTGLLTGLGKLLKMGQIDRVVMVNNWLLSTNLYPLITQQQIKQITEFLGQTFPKVAICFRSLNSYPGMVPLKLFQNNGYNLIASRQVYLFDPQNPTSLKSKMRWRLKQDANLFRDTGYKVISTEAIKPEEIPRLTELYKFLYLDKYCDNNPQFNQEFIKLALHNKALTLKALRKENRIDGVIGFYQLNGFMTTPLLGYDTRLPQNLGLYRMLSYLLMKEATQRQLILHQSSGAASFKRFRGFTNHIEYTAISVQHFPPYRQWSWHLLRNIANGVGIPLMQKFKV